MELAAWPDVEIFSRAAAGNLPSAMRGNGVRSREHVTLFFCTASSSASAASVAGAL
jgi:hypothetical protein